MTDAGRLRAAGPRATSARLAILERHHHLVCRRCGAVADVDCPAGHSPCLEPVTSAGYTIDEAQVTFWGLCARCREPQSPRG
jgi:Fur family transcriptional regulator, stress-responsive regulator